MIRFGIRGHDMGKYTISDFSSLIKLIKSLDGECLQLALAKSFTDFQFGKTLLDDKLFQELNQVLEKENIRLSVLGCYINLTNTDENSRLKDLEKFKAHLKFSKKFKTSLVGTETGCCNSEYIYTPLNDTEEAFNLFLDSMKKLISYAELYDTDLAIEGVAKHIIATPEKMKKALDILDSDRLKVIFDPVNFLTINNYINQKEIIKKSFELFGHKIVRIHIKDFIIENDEIKVVPIGKGNFELEFFINELKKYTIDIDILLENSTVEIAKECINSIKKYI